MASSLQPPNFGPPPRPPLPFLKKINKQEGDLLEEGKGGGEVSYSAHIAKLHSAKDRELPDKPTVPKLNSHGVAPVASSKITLGNLLDKIKSIASGAWTYLTNPYDPPWRSHEKYEHVLSEFSEAILQNLAEKVESKPEAEEDKEIPESKGDILIKKETPGKSSGKEVEKPSGKALIRDEIKNIQEGFLAKTEKPRKGSGEAECKAYLRTALQLLYAQEVPEETMTPRDRYKAFMEAYTSALETSYYKDLVKEAKTAKDMKDLQETNPYVAGLHAIARAQFTGVHVTDFFNSLSTKIAESGGFPPVEYDENLDPDQNDMFKALKKGIRAVDANGDAIARADPRNKTHFRTFAGSSIKGHTPLLTTFDPLNTGGNPANVHHMRIYQNGRQMMFIRTPSPTIGKEIHPSFKALLRSMKAEGEKFNYYNLQDRRQPHQHPTWKKRLQERLGVAREDRRVASLEALNQDPEFKDVICVMTLDKNSPFYWQNDKNDQKNAKALVDAMVEEGFIDKKEGAEYKKRISHSSHDITAVEELIHICVEVEQRGDLVTGKGLLHDKKDFIEKFAHNLFSDSPSFSIPSPYNQDPYRIHIMNMLKKLGETVFESANSLTPGERQDFIEMAYDLVEDYTLFIRDATHGCTVCKDCIDRGGGEIVKKQGKDLILEIVNGRPPYREGLFNDVQNWYATVNAPPLWARKRPILPERRGRLVRVMQRMVDYAQREPEKFKALQAMTQEIPIFQAPPLNPAVQNFDWDSSLKELIPPFRQMTDRFDKTLLQKALKVVNGEASLDHFEVEEQQKINKCIRDCVSQAAKMHEYYERVKTNLRGYSAWDTWKEHRNEPGYKPRQDAAGKAVKGLMNHLQDPYEKMKMVREIAANADPKPVFPEVKIKMREDQEVKGIPIYKKLSEEMKKKVEPVDAVWQSGYIE